MIPPGNSEKVIVAAQNFCRKFSKLLSKTFRKYFPFGSAKKWRFLAPTFVSLNENGSLVLVKFNVTVNLLERYSLTLQEPLDALAQPEQDRSLVRDMEFDLDYDVSHSNTSPVISSYSSAVILPLPTML